MQDLLGQTSHHSKKVRKEALVGLEELLQKFPAELTQQVLGWHSLQPSPLLHLAILVACFVQLYEHPGIHYALYPFSTLQSGSLDLTKSMRIL